MILRVRSRRIDSQKGQATVEYALILLVAVSVGMLVIRDLVRPTLLKLSTRIEQVVRQTLFNRANFHQYRP